jgi:hypothetical protein
LGLLAGLAKRRTEEVADFTWSAAFVGDDHALAEELNAVEAGWIFDDFVADGDGYLILLKRPKGPADETA